MEHDDYCHGGWLRVLFRIVFSIVVIATVVAVILGVFTGVFRGTPQNFFSWGWIGDLIGLFVFILILSWIFRLIFGHHGLHDPWIWSDEHSARILKRRYARGEISRDQFKRMMKDLKDHYKD